MLLAPVPSAAAASDDTAAEVASAASFAADVPMTPVSRLFFSAANVRALHDGLRYRVFVESAGRHVIGRQSDLELKVIMRGVHLLHARNLPEDPLGQVRALNAAVLDAAVPQVLGEIDIYLAYARDAARPPTPMPRSVSTSSAGTRTLKRREF